RRVGDRVERDDDDAGLAGFFDDAIDGGFGSGVDEQHIDLLEDQLGDLAILLGNGTVAIGGDEAGDLAVGLGLLGGGLEGVDHLVAPGVAIIGVGQRHDRRILAGKR